MLDIVVKLGKMEIKKYKIWRFAYTSYIDELILPSEMKLYQLDKSFDVSDMYYAKEVDKEVIKQSYIGTMKYSDEAWKILNDNNQTLNIECYNIFDNDIVVHVDQVYPLTDDFPVTDEYPSIGISYFEQRTCINQISDEEWNNFYEENKNKPNYAHLLKDYLYPISKYVKIQGIDKKFPLMLDVYEVILTTKLDDIPLEGLIHTSKNIDNVLPTEYNSRVKGKKITQSQYNFACAKQIGLISG